MDIAPDDGSFPDPQVPNNQHLVQVLLPERLHTVGEGICHSSLVEFSAPKNILFNYLCTPYDRLSVLQH